MREQKAELSKKFMKNGTFTARKMAINMYQSPEDVIPDEVVQAGLKDRSICVNAATIYACKRYHIAISPTVIDRFINRDSPKLYAAMQMPRNCPSQTFRAIVRSNLTYEYISAEVIKDGLDSYDSRLQLAALNACVGRDDIPLEWIENKLDDANWDIRTAAVNACAGRDDIPLEWIQKGLEDSDEDVRFAAINACAGRKDIPFEWIQKRLEDGSYDAQTAAANACACRDDISLEWIKDGLNNNKSTVRLAAINACANRNDVPLEWIEKMFNDNIRSLRLVAMRYFKTKNLPVPLKRTFEPSAVVYKKCLNGVIVCAEIPADAQVRGAEGRKCRADKVKIIDIIGNFCGEKVGISGYDNSALYFAGDEIEIEDFDYSNEECSTGFHFFCSKEEAEGY